MLVVCLPSRRRDAHNADPFCRYPGPGGQQLTRMMRATCLVHASQPATDAHDADPFAGMQREGPRLMLMVCFLLANPADVMLMMLTRFAGIHRDGGRN